MYFVYVLKNHSNGDLYIGYTKDLERRLLEHRRKFPKDEAIYYEAYVTDSDARERERKLKQYGSAWRGLKQRLKE